MRSSDGGRRRPAGRQAVRVHRGSCPPAGAGRRPTPLSGRTPPPTLRDAAAARVLVVVPLAADVDHALGRGRLHHRHALEGGFHEVDPDRQAQAAAGFAVAQGARLVVAHPDHGDQGRLEAGEPGVDRIVGGAGLAVQVGALEVACALAAVPERATSCSRRSMMKALRASMARTDSLGSGGWLSTRTLPLWSVILVTRQGLTR